MSSMLYTAGDSFDDSDYEEEQPVIRKKQVRTAEEPDEDYEEMEPVRRKKVKAKTPTKKTAPKSQEKKAPPKSQEKKKKLPSAAQHEEDAHFFVERRMAPHRLPTITASSSAESIVPPPDFWSRPIANFKTLAQAQRAFDHPHLLHSFFNKMDEMLNLMEANVGTSDFNTNLAREMIDHCTATIFCYGESGSGKSTLIRNLTNDPSAKSSHTVPGTEYDTHCIFKSGLRFIDTRGFRVPLVPNSAVGMLNAEWLKEYFQWERMLRSVRARMDSQVATDRPLGIMYCHKAGHRVVLQRIKELVTIPHQRMIPVYLVLTDVYAIDDEALAEFRKVFRNLVREIGYNPRGKTIHLLEVNSQPKKVRGREFGPTGMPQLASAILNSLEPMDILTFTHRSFLGIGAHDYSKKRSREE